MSFGRFASRSVFALGMALVACSRDAGSSRLLSKDAPVPFSEWCQAWELACPEGPAPNFPRPDLPWTVEQWQAALRMVNGVAKSPSRVEVSRAEIDDPRLDGIVEILNMEEVLASFRGRLDQNGLAAVKLDPQGFVRISFSSAGTWTTPRGIVVRHEAEATLGLEPDGTFRFTGLEIGSAKAASFETISWAKVTAPNVVDVGIGVGVVAGAPMAFVLDELLGEFRLPETNEPMPLDRLSTAIAPLREWLVRDDRWVTLPRSFLQQAARDLPLLVEVPGFPELGATVAAVVGALDVVQTGWHRVNGDFVKASLIPGRKVRCRVEGAPIVMEFKPEFGLRDLGGQDGRAWMELYGVTTKIDIPGPFDPSFEVSRVELTPEQLIIKNVPIIGQYALNLSEFSSPNGGDKKFICTSQ